MRSRLVVRDLTVDQVQIVSLDVDGPAPAIDVEAHLRGRRALDVRARRRALAA